MPIVTLKDLDIRDAAKAEARRRADDNGGVSDKQLHELRQKSEERSQVIREMNKKWKSREQRARVQASKPVNSIPDQIQNPEVINNSNSKINSLNKDNKCCLSNRACRFSLIGALSTALVIGLIAGLILGPLGALIGFDIGGLVGGVVGVVIAKYTECKKSTN